MGLKCYSHGHTPKSYVVSLIWYCSSVYIRLRTEDELAHWLTNSGNRSLVREISGIGPKTMDYLCKLVGLSAIPIDRHLIRFASWAGVNSTDYEELELTYRFTADLVGVDPWILDNVIWQYVTGIQRKDNSGKEESSGQLALGLSPPISVSIHIEVNQIQ